MKLLLPIGAVDHEVVARKGDGVKGVDLLVVFLFEADGDGGELEGVRGDLLGGHHHPTLLRPAQHLNGVPVDELWYGQSRLNGKWIHHSHLGRFVCTYEYVLRTTCTFMFDSRAQFNAFFF